MVRASAAIHMHSHACTYIAAVGKAPPPPPKKCSSFNLLFISEVKYYKSSYLRF